MLRRVVRHLRHRLRSLGRPPQPSWADRLRKEFLRDYALFRDYAAFESGTLYRSARALSDANLEALISIEYHRLEKGLSHVQRRASFGADAAQRLESALNEADARGLRSSITTYATDVLACYRSVLKGVEAPPVGWRTLSRDALLSASAIPARAFFTSRHSIRCFDPSQPVSLERIREAISLASHTPSVCNRQTWRVVICQSEQARTAALALQNGNQGFGHLASHVLIVASDRSCFASIGERNQPWIEGGLFAMSLVYALHSLGLGTCCLNWSVDNQRDAQLKQALDIPASYAIAMMIAVGSLPATIPVAESRRRTADDLLELR
ncbi:MAG: nitroreductase family protein [Cyanobacteria bacterium J06638_7]